MLTKIILIIITSLPILSFAKSNDVLFKQQLQLISEDCAQFERRQDEQICIENKINLAHFTEMRVRLSFNKLVSYCKTTNSDPDKDGWGYEDNKSCIVMGSKADKGYHKTNKNLRTLKNKGSNVTASIRIGETALFKAQMRIINYICQKDYKRSAQQKMCLVTNLDQAMFSETRVFSALNGGMPYCLKDDSDHDGDGYGWENEESCVVIDSAADKVDNYNTKREFTMLDTLINCESKKSDKKAVRCLSDGINQILKNK